LQCSNFVSLFDTVANSQNTLSYSHVSAAVHRGWNQLNPLS